jgi:hypothetical protein
MSRFHINRVAMLSAADALLMALKQAACFGELLKRPGAYIT